MRQFYAVSQMLRSLKGWVATGWAAVAYAADRIDDWLRHYYLRVDVWLVEGEEQNSHLPLAILCAAADQDRNYLIQLIFGSNYRQRHLGRYWLWNLDRVISAAGDKCSLLVLQMFESQLRFTHSSDWFLIPGWVLEEADLPRSAKAIRKADQDLRKMPFRNLQMEVTRDPKAFDDFYHNMYVPHLVQTYGDSAYLTPYKMEKSQSRRCDLLTIHSEEGPIAAELIMYEKPAPWLWDMGVRDGNQQYMKAGVGRALYHFAMQHLEQQGYRKVKLGWSRPFLHDGVLQFKRRWSPKIIEADRHVFALRLVSPTPAATAFLRNNPFIFQRGGSFYGAAFVDAGKPPTPEDLRRIDKDCYHLGLSRLYVYCLSGGQPPRGGLVPAELSDRIELRPAGDVLEGYRD